MKKLYSEQKHSIYEIQKKAGLNKYTLYKYINGESNINNIRFGTLEKIAKIEGLDPDILLKKIKEYQKNNIDII